LNYYTDVEADDILYPTIKDKIAESAKDIQIPKNPEEKGRVPVITEAIRLLKRDIGDKVAIGTYLLGPYTLAGQIIELNDLLKKSFKEPEAVVAVLEVLSDLIIILGKIYKQAGVDYITLREMGACADVMNPRMFKNLVQPHLIRILKALEPPCILHICGSTNQIIKYMEECGADALSVDHKNDLKQSRKDLKPETLLFGNLDTFKNLVQGTPAEVEEAVEGCLDMVDAVWPGCDIWPTASPENIRAMVGTTRDFSPKA
jgi:[methyl-Co(III) methanol-specific corrinoid protein]:coenzyme M methyltransferase